MWKLCFAAVTAARGAISELGSASPTQKVIDLLTDLKATSQEELTKETEVFTKFLDFCKTRVGEKAGAIDADNLNIETANGGIAVAKAAIETALVDFETAIEKQNKKSFELSERSKQWLEAKGELKKTEADLEKAVSSLGAAVEHLNAAKSSELVSLKETIKQNLLLADALGLSSHATSFLSKGPPGEYNYHSGDIIKVLETLKTEFSDKLTEVKVELEKQTEAFNSYKEATQAAIDAAKETATTAQESKDQETENLGKHDQDLTNGKIDLKNDSKYHKDLTQRCNTKKAEWKQREQGRKDEIAAIEGALTQLETTLGKEAGRTTKTFIQKPKKEVRAATVSKDTTPKAKIGHDKKSKTPAAASFLQMKRFLSPVSPHEKAAAFVLAKGKSLKSSTLVSLSSQMGGPFDKVKRLIQSLIERLLDEAANEAGHQSKCAVERKEAELNRGYRHADIEKKNADLQGLSALKSELEVKIEDLTTATGELEKTLEEEAKLRAEDKENNLTAIKEAKEGLAALQSAVQILTEYYKGVHGVGGADTATVLTQASPVDEEAEWQAVADTKGAYKGAQAASGNIFGLLGVVKSDFQREISTTQEEEKTTQDEYVKQKREDTASLAGKRTELDNAENDLKVTSTKLNVGFNDLQTLADRQGKAIKVLELLWERCVSVEMTWEERKAKIEEEIEALKKAVTILGG